jgi:hypothetical protein
MNLFQLLSFFVIFYLQNVQASSFTEPHDHQGIVSPFTPGDPKIALDKKALEILASGKPYQTQIQSGTGGRGLVVQDVDAPTDIVWGRILDYDNYAKMVPKTVESKNYKVQNVKPTKKDPLSQIIYTRMKVGFPVLKLEFFVKHLYYPELNSLTWTLDYSKKSDFNDSCGFWFVIPHPEDDQRTRLFYSVEVSMFDWVPKFVVDFMSTKALTDATAWVKKFSEMEYEKQKKERSQQQLAIVSKSNKQGNSQGKKKKGFFENLMFWKHKAEAENERKRAQEEEAKKMAEAARLKEEEEARKKIFVSWTRLGMASAIFVFSIYNVHLKISS